MYSKYILAITAALGLSACVETTGQQVTKKPTYKTFEKLDLYGSSYVIRYHTENRKLSKNSEKAFRGKFRDKSYYGAFTYSASDVYGWGSGHNTLKTAIEYALKGCQTIVRPGEAGCKLYATMVPKGYTKKSATTLSKASTETYHNFQNNTGFRAIAINDSGITRLRKRNTLARAKDDALFDCNASANSHTRSIQKVRKCRILGVGEFE